MGELSPAVCMGYTCIWLSIVPIQVARCPTYEAHILQTEVVEGADSEFGCSPNGHDKSE